MFEQIRALHTIVSNIWKIWFFKKAMLIEMMSLGFLLHFEYMGRSSI